MARRFAVMRFNLFVLFAFLPTALSLYCYPAWLAHNRASTCRNYGLRERNGQCCGHIRVLDFIPYETITGPRITGNLPYNCVEADLDFGSLFNSEDEGDGSSSSSGESENTEMDTSGNSGGSGNSGSTLGGSMQDAGAPQLGDTLRRRRRQTDPTEGVDDEEEPYADDQPGDGDQDGDGDGDGDECPTGYRLEYINAQELCCFGRPHPHIKHHHFDINPYAYRRIVPIREIMMKYQGDYNSIAGRFTPPRV